MTFEKTFCPSPWFHARIKNNGDFEFCRWSNTSTFDGSHNIKDVEFIIWFQESLSKIRQNLLAGKLLSECSDCHGMELHGKISGRQRQLIKTGVDIKNFANSMLSTPWLDSFKFSQDNQGLTDQWPQDWQIDLGNYCNSACMFCGPHCSSRLATEFHKLGLISRMPPPAWCDDEESLDKFVKILLNSPRLVYLHFIGGETLITPAFKKILTALIDNGLHQQISIGFTTNLTSWRNDVIELLKKFKEVHVGISIECLHPLNDYVRYGGSLDSTVDTAQKWITEGRHNNWLLTVRVTPTVFSIWHLDTVYQFVLNHGLSIESCNFLDKPECMRPSVLPREYRDQVISKLSRIIDSSSVSVDPAINLRSRQYSQSHAIQDCQSYINYLLNQSDESYRLPQLVKFVTTLERSRKNRILDYLPEYEKLLRSAGYQF